MKHYSPDKLVALSRYQNFFPTLSSPVQKDVYERISELIDEEKQYYEKRNYIRSGRKKKKSSPS